MVAAGTPGASPADQGEEAKQGRVAWQRLACSLARRPGQAWGAWAGLPGRQAVCGRAGVSTTADSLMQPSPSPRTRLNHAVMHAHSVLPFLERRPCDASAACSVDGSRQRATRTAAAHTPLVPHRLTHCRPAFTGGLHCSVGKHTPYKCDIVPLKYTQLRADHICGARTEAPCEP